MTVCELKESILQKIESSLKQLRIADVELFITAAHLKNLGKAAKLHHLSQSAASSVVPRVEMAFGVSLCTHEKRHFTLTREGKILLPRLEKWVRELRDLIISKDKIPIRFFTTHAIAQIAVPALLSVDNIEFKHMRPDKAYKAILHDDADIALVLDNANWKGVISAEIGKGNFQLYSRNKNVSKKAVLLPENQMEVLAFQQSWLEIYKYALPVKSRIPSWSLIADICANSDEVGFLPDFLAHKYNLQPVLWQPNVSRYRILAIHRGVDKNLQERFAFLFEKLQSVFISI